MASLSPALRLGDLPPPHRTFQGHAPHIIEGSMMLRPNDSWSTCRPQGIASLLHYASRRSAGLRYTTLNSYSPATSRRKCPRAPCHKYVFRLYIGKILILEDHTRECVLSRLFFAASPACALAFCTPAYCSDDLAMVSLF